MTRALWFRAWSRRGASAAAALTLVAVGVWLITYSPTPAMASLNDIISALGIPGERIYNIQMEDLPEPPGQRPQEEDWPQHMPRPGLDDATIYLRDGRQYLLVRNDPKGGLIDDGYDGHAPRLSTFMYSITTIMTNAKPVIAMAWVMMGRQPRMVDLSDGFWRLALTK